MVKRERKSAGEKRNGKHVDRERESASVRGEKRKENDKHVDRMGKKRSGKQEAGVKGRRGRGMMNV